MAIYATGKMTKESRAVIIIIIQRRSTMLPLGKHVKAVATTNKMLGVEHWANAAQETAERPITLT